MHIDRICLKHAKCNTNVKGEHSTQPLEELTMYKCLVPAQNRLPNARVEEVGEMLNNFKVGNKLDI